MNDHRKQKGQAGPWRPTSNHNKQDSTALLHEDGACMMINVSPERPPVESIIVLALLLDFIGDRMTKNSATVTNIRCR